MMKTGIGFAALAALCAVILTSPHAALAKNGPGGKSAGHMSEQGTENTNNPNTGDQEKGLERSRERMNEEGAEHQKAPGASDQDTGKGKGKGKAKGKGKGKGKGGKPDSAPTE